VWEIARHELYLKRKKNVEISSSSSSSSVAHYPRRVSVFPICSPPAIPILRYLSPINNSHLSHVIIYTILSSTLGSPLGIFSMVHWLAPTVWTVRGSNPGGGETFRTCPDRPCGPPSLLYNGYRVFTGGKLRPGRDADPSPPSNAEVKNRVELYLYSL
jgi:hypothetical protein